LVPAAIAEKRFQPFLLILLLFVAVGVVLLYAGLRSKYAIHLLIVDPHSVILGRSLFGRTKQRALARTTVRSVMKKVFYEQNYQPVYGVEVRGDGGKLRFGTMLDEGEKDWLVCELRRALGLQPGGDLPTERKDRNPTRRRREGSFTATLPQEPIIGALAGFVAVSLGFVVIGLVAIKDAAFFRVLWLGFSGLCAVVGCLGVVAALRRRGITTEIAVLPHEVRCRRRRGSRVLEEATMARDELVAVRCYDAGRMNSRPAYAFELVGEKSSLPLAFYLTAAELPGFAQDLAERLWVDA
jgi:hypothetical protein